MTSSKFLSVTTLSADGSTFVAFPSATPVTVLHVLNNTGTSIDFARVGDASAIFTLPTAFAWSFRGLTDSSQIQVKRTDNSNTGVTLYAEAELESRS